MERAIKGEFTMKRRGYSLVEILIVVIILAILAAIVIPKFSDASDEARTASLAKDLQTLRTQIEVFKGHHDGITPGQGGLDIVAQFTGKTDDSGAVVATGKHGPYMLIFPTNPWTDKATVESGTGAPGGGDHGWYYNTDTGRIYPDDDAHKDQ
jgi:prepilin-type N-terminal cleavage/methylation domain-containing protein